MWSIVIRQLFLTSLVLMAGCTTMQGYLLGRPMEADSIPGFASHLRVTPGTAVQEAKAWSG